MQIPPEILEMQKNYINLYIFETLLTQNLQIILTEKNGNYWIKKIDFFNKKEQDKILESNYNVSKLTLGFWTGLFHKFYYDSIWKDNNNIEKMFPKLKSKQRNIKIIESDLNQIRLFRNKIFHFEIIQLNEIQNYENIVVKYNNGLYN